MKTMYMLAIAASFSVPGFAQEPARSFDPAARVLPIVADVGSALANTAGPVSSDAHRSPNIVMNFDGLRDRESVSDYYNGGLGGSGSGPGPNYGITFTSNPMTLSAGSSNVSNMPSAPRAMGFSAATSTAIINRPAGFVGALRLPYTSPFTEFRIQIYSEANGGGLLLAEALQEPTPVGSPFYSNWAAAQVEFPGVGRSVRLIVNKPGHDIRFLVFDNIELTPLKEGFDCVGLQQVLGAWGESDGRCGNFASNATTPKYESAQWAGGVTIAESRGVPMGYTYTVEAVVNRPRQRTAANSIFVHGSPFPLQSSSQWWNRKLAFNISGDGRYSIFRYNGTARPAAIQAWTPIMGTTVAVPPATNTLQVVSNGSTLSFVLNGVTLRTIPTEFAVEDFGIGFVRSVPSAGTAADDWIGIADVTVDVGRTIAGGNPVAPQVSAEQEATNLRANSADQLQSADAFFALAAATDARK